MLLIWHLHIKQGSNGRRQEVMDGWKQLMGDSLRLVEDYRDVPKVIADIVTGQKSDNVVVHSGPAEEAPAEEDML